MSCAGSLVERGYDTAMTAEITYNASRQILKDMDQRGQLTEDQKTKVIEVASDYYEGVIILKKALISYKKAKTIGEERQIAEAEIALTAALNFVMNAEINLLRVVE
jgi:hypothetical protein